MRSLVTRGQMMDARNGTCYVSGLKNSASAKDAGQSSGLTK